MMDARQLEKSQQNDWGEEEDETVGVEQHPSAKCWLDIQWRMVVADVHRNDVVSTAY